MTIDNKTGEVEWNPGPSDVGDYSFRVIVSDGMSSNDISLSITINASTTPPDNDDGDSSVGFNPLFIIIIIIVMVAVAAVAGIAVLRRKGAKAGQIPAPQPATAPGSGPSPPVQPVMETSTPHPSSQMQPVQMGPQAGSASMVTAVATPIQTPGLVPPAPTKDAGVEDFDVEAVLLMSTDGRLIASEMGADSTMDRDILSSMLTAIGDFVKQSFRDETGLNSFETGGRQVLLIKGQHASITVVLLGKEPPGLREQMQRMLETFEGQYAGVIDRWDGNLGYFDGVDRLFIPLLDFKKGVAIKEEVKVKSAIEFYQGYVRLKVAVINNFQRTIADATLQIEYDPGALRLAKVEPSDIKAEGPVVRLGNIRNSGKKTVAFYLDPLICQGSFIDAHLTYYDFQDVKYHVEMKRRPVDVVCPLFYTNETVNIAVLKRLVSELKNKDARRFRVNGQQNIDKAFREAIAEIKAHDVKLVRTYADGQVGSGRFTGEAWFYGETKDRVDRIVIMTRFSECDMMLELMVAADNLAAQAGLLAEMGAMVKTRCGDILEPLFGERYDQLVCKTDYLLDRDETAGAAPGERRL